MSTIKLSELKIGEKAVIEGISDSELENKLLDMGCIPGEEISFERKSPFGDPSVYFIAGYRLALRKNEAASIIVNKSV